jgi:DNA-binding MarR family transcriptional regulator
MTTSPQTDLELPSRVRLAATRLSRRLRQQAQPGLTPSMLSALSCTVRRGQVSLGKLAAAEGVQPPTMTRIVEALVNAGLVRRTRDPADGRSMTIEATAEGKALLSRRARQTDAYLASLLRDLPERDLRTLDRAADIIERLLEVDR